MPRISPLVLVVAAAVACSGSPTGPNPNPGPLPTPTVACAAVAPVQLAVGVHVVIDPAATSGCVRFPAAGNSAAQYLLVLASTNGVRSSTGVQGGYLLRSSSPTVQSSAEPAPSPAVSAEELFPSPRSAAAEFDATLRERERELLALPGSRAGLMAAPPVSAAPPPVGDVKSFKVCTNLQCSAFGTVMATAKFVGQHVAIYLDNDVPQADPLQPGDFAELGNAFDTYHFPIDTTAFGRESDLDANGVVEILMTDAVNALTPDCTNGRIIGYFFGGDLLTGANSNRAEVFYTLVPAPQSGTCNAVSRRAALDNLKPTLIHEFQHMISFNQHALVRGGNAEETWLNEAMSHFAEELGGRLVPAAECTQFGFPSCRSQYASGDIINAYNFLKNSENFFLFFGSSSTGTLEERGADWLFLRWILDHFSTDTILATQTSRALVATSLTGVSNVAAVTGSDVATMLPEELMAAYLDDGDDLPAESTGLLRFKSWGLRSIWLDPRNASTFPAGFPIVPDPVGASFSRSGTLRAGSGHHFLVIQQANGPAIDVQVLKNSDGSPLDPTLQGRYGVVRIR